jgi:uncharacterized membrane protein
VLAPEQILDHLVCHHLNVQIDFGQVRQFHGWVVLHNLFCFLALLSVRVQVLLLVFLCEAVILLIIFYCLFVLELLIVLIFFIFINILVGDLAFPCIGQTRFF